MAELGLTFLIVLVYLGIEAVYDWHSRTPRKRGERGSQSPQPLNLKETEHE